MPDPSANERRILVGESFGAPVPGRWPGPDPESMDEQAADPRVLPRSGQAWALSICWGVGVAVGIGAFVDGDWTPADLLFGVIALTCVALMVRPLRAYVVLEADAVVLRGAFRTRRISWSDVDHAKVVPGARIPRLMNVQITTKDGKHCLAEGVARFCSRRSEAERLLGVFSSEINSRSDASQRVYRP